MAVGSKKDSSPWYADLVNYLACGLIPEDFSYQQKKKFIHDSKQFYLDEPYLFKHCVDGIMRRCVSSEETMSIIQHCHSAP